MELDGTRPLYMTIKAADQVHEIRICLGSSCFSRGNRDLVQRIKQYLASYHLEDKVFLKGAHCLGECSKGPLVIIDGETHYGENPESIMDLLEGIFNTQQQQT